MERRREMMEEGPGWLATLGGALVLVVLGFGVGLVAGAAFEEPDLVVDHLAGRTTEVALARGSEPREKPYRVIATSRPEPEERPPLGWGHADLLP